MDEPPSLDFLLSFTKDLGSAYPVIYFLATILLLMLLFISASNVIFSSISIDELIGRGSNLVRPDKVTLQARRKLILSTIRLMNIIARSSLASILALTLFDVTPLSLSSSFYMLCIIGGTIAFVELAPKLYVHQNPIRFARLSLGPWLVLAAICKPAIKLYSGLMASSKALHHVPGDLSDENDRTNVEKDMLSGIAAFGKLTVRQVMRTRSEISSIDSSSDFKTLMDIIDKCGFSRIPVYRNTIDTIEGVLYIKDLLPFLYHPNDFQWRSLVRPGFIVNENRKIDSLLKDFQDKRVHMAVVVDEQSKTTGIVTLEDLIEEIIGEINDEFDEVEPATDRKRKDLRAIVHERE